MIKINRPPTPDIKVYTEKNQNLSTEERNFLLALLDSQSIQFGSFIPRLQDEQERFTKAEEETLKAIAYYANPENFKDNKKLTSAKAPNFKVYKDPELKELLKATFHKKCAYCESLFLQVSPADIEHFRPKAAINRFVDQKDEKLIYPGYYWLAADWDNLLWSCILCNRKNNLDVPNTVADEFGQTRQALGKKNRFPVLQETLRIRSHNEDLTAEHTHKLILDPCRDNPKEHLFFPLDDEDLGIVKSSIMEDQNPSPKGEASIPVYGLNRTELVLARKQAALDLKSIFLGLLHSLKAFISKQQKQENTDAEEEEFLFQKERFNTKLDAESEYLALKNHLLEEFNQFDLLQQLQLKVEDLIE